jgi:hypothetical protein
VVSLPQTPTPAENLSAFLRGLLTAVCAMMGGERLSLQVIAAITDRIRQVNQRFGRLAARLAAGTYKPRRFHGRKPAAAKPRRRSPLPHEFGWLLPLVTDAVGYRAQLEHLLLRNPEMLALMEQAPVPMARILRPLCWMLRLEPPPVLARPRPKAPPPRRKASPRSKPPKVKVRRAPPALTAKPAPPAPPGLHARGPPLRG